MKHAARAHLDELPDFITVARAGPRPGTRIKSSALPFLSSRSSSGVAIYVIAIYDINALHNLICLSFFWQDDLLSSQINGTGQSPSLHSYSVRNAAIGLIRVARRAGSQVATRVAAPSRSGAVENAIGSSEPT